MQFIYTLLTGVIFGIGISLSGMIDPAKVLNFFDITGMWDPSLGMVMGGALLVTYVGYRLVWRLDKPIFTGSFRVPRSKTLDAKLIGGSALFGVGWGVAGFCPGAAIVALGTGRWEIALFLLAVVLGMFLHRQLSRYMAQAK